MSKTKTPEPADETVADATLELEEALKDGIDEAHAFLKRNWEERPLTVAATALGIGLVLGVLLGSRR